MSVSNFMILVGHGHPYGGEGMMPTAMLSFFDDKGIWVVHHLDGMFSKTMRRWATTQKQVFDDAFLAVSLAIVGPQVPDIFQKLIDEANRIFNENVKSVDEDLIDMSETGGIPRAELDGLYELNRKVLFDTNVKLVGIQLRYDVLVIGPHTGPATLGEAFMEAVDSYGIQTAELCVSDPECVRLPSE